ncbi:MAG TPA: F0F1 ATP synthase subunit epsilon [Ferrovibrio sp.]|jgi:F-type H+-transporting ATPase subunit epsilon|uniref:F0F1 ATP synthase subunit epsilon n=1 Tax=Ferrovibrio sp. TaxID=1917215 RepID=UPI002B4B308A|nr:F0F1 ATP synthase subunit epsilon [Ferrovibrio sp.]HLT76665.1 F0F1 ATP synthase subunit epsilon [Ferrovibrio sp.]
MAETVKFELVSPEKLLLSLDAEMVVVPGEAGDFGVLPGHSPLISTIRNGVIEVTVNGQVSERIFVAGGFAEVANDKLTVLAEEAVPVNKLDRAKVEQQLKDAREDFEDAKDDHAKARCQAQVEKYTAMLEAAA